MIRVYPRRVPPEWRGIRQHSTSIKALLAGRGVRADVTVTGWINHKRKLKNATFLDVTDGSAFRSLQVVAGSTPERFIDFSLTSNESERPLGPASVFMDS